MHDSEQPEIPEEVHAEFSRLRAEVWALCRDWQLWEALYGVDDGRVDILNQAAAGFFATVQGVFQDRIMLGLARLLDPAETRKKPNLVLAHLVKRVAPYVPEDVAKDLDLELDAAMRDAENLVQIRNKRIAHIDLGVAMGSHLLSSMEKGDARRLLKSICDLLNKIQCECWDGTSWYEDVGMVGGAAELLSVLRLGVKAHEDERDRRLGRVPRS